MANCIIRKNDKGDIMSVSTRSGERSILFDRIAGLPVVGDIQTAMDAFLNIFSEDFIKKFGNWESSVPKNKKAVNTLKSKIKSFGIENGEAIIKRANSMSNPVLLRVHDKGVDSLGRMNYKEYDGVGTPVLYDDNLSVSLDLNEDNPNMDLLASDNPDINVTDKDGTYKSIINGLDVIPVANIEDTKQYQSDTYPNGEPKLFFRTSSGKIYDSYAAALNNTNSDPIECGFRYEGGFYSVLSVDSSINTNTVEGVANYLIAEGYLSEYGESTQTKDGIQYVLDGAGSTVMERNFNKIFATFDGSVGLNGVKIYTTENGFVKIEKTDDRPDDFQVFTGGVSRYVSKESVKQKLKEGKFNELKRLYGDAAIWMTTISYMEDNSNRIGKAPQIVPNKEKHNNKLIDAIHNILGTLGVSVTGIREWSDRAIDKEGDVPGIRAVASLAQKVIALAEGSDISDMSEEVCHFLLETYVNQSEIEEARGLVRETDEYKLHEPTYREVYGKRHSGEALERIIDMEVLGKILTEKFNNRLTQDPASTQRDSFFWDLFNRIINSIQAAFTNQKTKLDSILDKIVDDSINDLSSFDERLLEGKKYSMYSLEGDKVLVSMKRQYDRLKIQYDNLLRVDKRYATPMARYIKDLRSRLDGMTDISDAMFGNKTRGFIQMLVGTADAQVSFYEKMIRKYQKESAASGKVIEITPADQQLISDLNDNTIPMLQELSGYIAVSYKDLGFSEIERDSLKTRIGRLSSMISELNGISDAVRKDDIVSMVKAVAEYSGGQMTDSDLSSVGEILNGVNRDVSFITKWVGTMDGSSNPILSALATVVLKNSMKANMQSIEEIKGFVKQVEDGGFDISKFKRLIKKHGKNFSNYLKNEIDLPKFYEALETAQVEYIQKMFPEIEGEPSDIAKGSISFHPNRMRRLRIMRNDRADLNLPQNDKDLWDYAKQNNFIIDGVFIEEGEVSEFKADAGRFSFSFMNADESDVFKKMMDEWRMENEEKPYTQEYYDIVGEIYKSSGASVDAIKAYKDYSAKRSRVRQRFIDDNGVFDRVAFSLDKFAQEEMAEIRSAQLEDQSMFYSDGTRKVGADLAFAEDMKKIGQAWSEFYKKNKKESSVSQEFFDELDKLQSNPREAFDFLRRNGFISFKEEFWKQFSDPSYKNWNTIMDRIEEAMEKEGYEKPVIDSFIRNKRKMYEEVSEMRRELLKSIGRRGYPGEVEFSMVTQSVKDKLNEYEDTLSSIRSDIMTSAKDFVPKDLLKLDINQSNNITYKEQLDDFKKLNPSMPDSEAEFQFCLENMSPSKRREVLGFRTMIRSLTKKSKIRLNRDQMAAFNKVMGDTDIKMSNNVTQLLLKPDGTIDEESVSAIENVYASSVVYPYLKKIAPDFFHILEDDIYSGKITVSDFVRNVLEKKTDRKMYSMVEISINNDWHDADGMFDKYKNKNFFEYDDSYGAHKPKKELYLDEEYFSYFDIDGSGVARSNKDEWDMIQSLKELKRLSLDENHYNEDSPSSKNLYMIPQMSQSAVERMYSVKDTGLFNMIKRAVNDSTRNRIDDPMYGMSESGELANDSVVRSIPKYFLRKLEQSEDVSHDLAKSYSALISQSNLYNQRSRSISMVMNLQNGLLSTRFKGKRAESTNAFAMFKEFMDYHFYGVRVNKAFKFTLLGKEFDVTKIAQMFINFVRWANLAFNPAVAATAAVSSRAMLGIEGILGRQVNARSLRFADKEFNRMSFSYLTEMGNLNRKNKLYALGEFMGIYKTAERMQTAGFNRVVRVITDEPAYAMMSMLNFPIAPKIMIALMDETRLVGEKFMTRTQFFENGKKEGKTKNELKAEWELLQKDSLYNIIDVDDEGNIKFREGVDPKLVKDNAIFIASKTAVLNSAVDGVVMPELNAMGSRHPAGNAVLMHRGWMQIAFQRMFKRKGYNFTTGQWEEGTARTFGNYASKVYNSMFKEKDMLNFKEAFAKNYSSMTDWERKNLHRVGIEVGMFAVLSALSILLAKWSDDDDNRDNWLVQFGCYIAFRSINELVSNSVAGAAQTTLDTMDSPIVISRSLLELANFNNYSLDTVKSGVYKGETRLQRHIFRSTVLKNWANFKSGANIYQAQSGYRLYNSAVLPLAKKRPKDDEDIDTTKGDVYNYVFIGK